MFYFPGKFHFLVKTITDKWRLHKQSLWGGDSGREPERTGAGRVRETGEERAGSGISTMMGSQRQIQKGKFLLF